MFGKINRTIPLTSFVPAVFIILGLLLNLFVRQDRAAMIKQVKTFENDMVASRKFGPSLDHALKEAQEQLRLLAPRFSGRDEDIIRQMNEAARELEIDLQAINSQPRTVYLTDENMSVKVNNQTCYQLLVSLEFKGTYQQLLGYLDALEKKLAVMFTVEQLTVKRILTDPGQLAVSLTCRFYLLM